MIPSMLYAQEIVENQINESKEAVLRKSSLKNETYENEVKSDLNLEATNPSFGTREDLLALRSRVIPKNAFSYTQDWNFPSKPKPPLLPKPKSIQRFSCETTENDTSNRTQNLHSCAKTDSKHIKSDKSYSISPISSDSLRTGNLNNSEENHHLEDTRYIKLEDTETVAPPLPSRPPPVFKYPLGTFYKETDELNETKANDEKEHQKQTKSSQIKCFLSGQIAENSSINVKDRIVNERCVSLNNEDNLSEIQEHISVKPLLEQELKINKDNLRNLSQETDSLRQKSAQVLTEQFKATTHSRKSIPPKTIPDVFKKRSISIAIGIQENKPPKPLPRPDFHINEDIKKSLSSDNISGVFQKRSISIPLGIQENKPPKPLPRPELHINKDKSKSLSSENISGAFQKRSISISLEMNKSLALLPGSDVELNKNKWSDQKSKSADSQDIKKTKPNVPSKPNNLFPQRLGHILVEQSLREQNCLNPTRKLSQPLEKNFAELSETDWSDMKQPTSQTNVSRATKASLDSSARIKVDDESLESKPENLNFENIKMDSSSSAELKEDQSTSDLNQDHIADISVFHSLSRPTLPQKMKSTQRSLSYNSLVQTVKDIGATIWNPSDKSKRSSTGMIPKVTEEKTQHSSSRTTKDIKVSEDKRSPEEEKAAIMRSAWFHDISATEAQHRLLKLDQDGAFLIRPTSRPTDNIQYTASITYGGRVFNIHIRSKANNHFALGKEKEGEKSFQRLSDLIKYYQDVPFDIHPVGSSEPHAICFRVTPSR